MDIAVYGSNDLFIQHIVQSYKLNLPWFFKMRKQVGISNAKMTENNIPFEFIKAVCISFMQAIILPVMNLPKLLNKNYYLQNFIIDSFTKPYKWFYFAKSLQWKSNR